MISYYPNVNHLNEAFDKAFKAFVYEQGNPEQERAAQQIYELCAKIYKVGFRDGVDKMTQNTVKMLREWYGTQDTDNAGR